MGKRGPKGMPTNVRLLHGDREDRINRDEPMQPDGEPVPDEMSDEVRAIWDYTLEQLRGMKLASPADRDSLMCYCEAVVTHRRASRLLARSNVIVRTVKGDAFMKNPLVQIQRDAAMVIRIFAREFGLTPSGRSEIHMHPGNNGDGDKSPDRLFS